MKRFHLIAAFAMLLIALPIAAYSQQATLSNSDVVSMIKAGLGAQVVVAKINDSPSAFDTTPAALAALKQSGVPDAVVLAMVNHKNPGDVHAADPATEKPHAAVPLKEARVFIDNMNGFETYLTAAFEKKHVPMTVVASKANADYVIEGTSQSQKAGWAKMLIAGSIHSAETASVRLVSLNDGQIVWAYSVNKSNSYHGMQSTAEACAKHLKQFIEKQERPEK